MTEDDRSNSDGVDHEFVAARLGQWARTDGALFRSLADRLAELVAASDCGRATGCPPNVRSPGP